MGDRANVAIREDGKDVWLYTHWQGTELPRTVQRALMRQQRWTDAAYLARIVFCMMVKGQEAGETGFGISLHPIDDTPVMVLDVDKQVIHFGSTSDDVAHGVEIKDGMSFDDFVAAPAYWPED